jgi:hypothetical protein
MNAPRVTIEDIEANISSEYYLNAGDAAAAVGYILGADTLQDQGTLKGLTLCIIVLKNGFKVVGTSAVVSLDNFNEDLGRKYAREAAIRQCWDPMGYALREAIYQASRAKVI